jgi:hypothetical protein
MARSARVVQAILAGFLSTIQQQADPPGLLPRGSTWGAPGRFAVHSPTSAQTRRVEVITSTLRVPTSSVFT